MPDLQILRDILLKYDAKKVSRDDLLTPSDIYELNPQKCNRYACRDDIEHSGFKFSDWASGEYFNKLAGYQKLIKPSREIRGSTPIFNGALEVVDDSDEADGKVIEALKKGETVCYESKEEKERVESKLKPGQIAISLGIEYLLHREIERGYIQEGNAIFLASPECKGEINIYGLIIERLPQIMLTSFDISDK